MANFTPLLNEEDYIKIDEELESMAVCGGYEVYRDIFIMKIYLYTKISLPELLRLTPEKLVRTRSPHFGVWDSGKQCVMYKFPPEKIYEDVMRFFPLRENSKYVFYDDSNIDAKITPFEIEYLLKNIILNACGKKPDNIHRFIKQSFENISNNGIQLGGKRKRLISEMKEHMAKWLDNPAPSNAERHTYICKVCGEEGECIARNIKEFMRIVLERDKTCLKCIDENNKKVFREKQLIRKEKQQACAKRNNRPETHRSKLFIERECVICHIPYCGTVETCGPECKKKNTEKKRFYDKLSLANKEVHISKIRVYGQGRTEFIQIKKRKGSGKLSAVHPEDLVFSRKSIVDEGLSERDIFEHSVAQEAKVLIESPAGEQMGLTLDVLDELIVTSMGIHTGRKIQDPKICVKIALGI